LFAAIAVFVAILGLIGLAAFVSEKRTKEIGIRKILGGSRLEISKLLLWQFAKPVILSNTLAWPLAYLALTQWLNGFERRIDLVYLSFLAASGVTLVLALTTVLVYALRTAGMNPVRALRHE
jgi:putative ABC transport system permease protein